MPRQSAIGAKLRITGGEALIRNLVTKWPDRLRTKLADALDEGVREVEARATELAPFKDGHLRRSIRSEVDRSRLRAFVIAGDSLVNYAGYQEYGTYANRIESNNINLIGKVLKARFASGSGGKGIMPKLYMHRGIAETQPRLVKIMELKINELVREINR